MKRSKESRDHAGTVLVVEDNPDDTLLLQVAAREACPDIGFHFVEDGVEALAYLKGEGKYRNRQAHPFPSVLLVDLRLPRLSGVQVLEHVRGLPAHDGLKLLAWSDGTDPHAAELAREAGAEFIPKPTLFRELVERVGRICEQARRAG